MKRRELFTLLGGTALAWPLAVGAQQSLMPVIGVLGSGTSNAYAAYVAAFVEGLGQTGYIEGRNVAIEFRGAADQPGRSEFIALTRKKLTGSGHATNSRRYRDLSSTCLCRGREWLDLNGVAKVGQAFD